MASLVDYYGEHGLTDTILMGHSYGGMAITGAADRLPAGSIRRLVYWNAFVPNDGEALNDMVPPPYVQLFASLEANDGSVTLPYAIWRDAFINDADDALAQQAYDVLNPHPNNTFKDKISLSRNPADIEIPKSYLKLHRGYVLAA